MDQIATVHEEEKPLKAHSGENSLACKYCNNYVGVSKGALRQHYSSKHRELHRKSFEKTESNEPKENLNQVENQPNFGSSS